MTATDSVQPLEFAALPALGVGLGFRPAFAAEVLHQPAQADFLEITIEHYLGAPKEKMRELDQLRESYTLIPHGLNMSLGSAEGLNHYYLRAVAELIEKIDPPWWSEHICFTRAGGIDIGHLSPLPYTEEAIEVLCDNIAEVKKIIPTPLILENISYLLSLGGEMSEESFIAKVLERSDCGMLLDVTNLYINAANHGYDWRHYLRRLPLERVVQLHFVGGHQQGDLLIDSHSRATPESIWEVLEAVLTQAPVKGMILERDDNLPAFAELAGELDRARQLGRSSGRWS